MDFNLLSLHIAILQDVKNVTYDLTILFQLISSFFV